MTYRDYIEGYTGREAIDEKDFEFFIEKAETVLSNITFGRSRESELDEVVYATVEIAQYLFENGGREGILRESNDGLSVSYQSGFSSGGRAYDIAKTWLGGTGLMYAGVERRDNY